MDGSERRAAAARFTQRTVHALGAVALCALVALAGCGGDANDGSLGSSDGQGGLPPDSLVGDVGDSASPTDVATDVDTGPTPDVGTDADTSPTPDVDATTLTDADADGADAADAEGPSDASEPSDADATPPTDADDVEPGDADTTGAGDVDTAGPDDGDAGDGAGACEDAADCSNGVCALGWPEPTCVECVKAADCDAIAGPEVCVQNQCVQATPCDSDKDCLDIGAVCDEDTGACADCVVATDCGADLTCLAGQCLPEPQDCDSSKDCADLGLICHTKANVCVDCVDDGDCEDGLTCIETVCVPDGSGPDPVCEPGATDCDGAALLTCLPDGSGWDSSPCDDGAPCTVDGCEAGACTHTPAPAGITCEGNDPCGVYACDDAGACVASGEKFWSRAYDLEDVDVEQHFADVVALADGGFMVAAPCPGCDEVVARLDEAGDVLWQKSFEGGRPSWLSPGSSGGYAVRTYDGQIHRANEAMDHQWTVAPGTSFGAVTFGLPSSTVEGGVLAPGHVEEQDSAFTDGALVAVGSDGLPDWAQSYGDTDIDEQLFVARELADGSLVAGGRVGSYQAASHDMWLVRLHPDGQLQWQQTYPSEGGAEVERLAVHPDGGFVLAGSWREGTGDAERQIHIIRTDAFGFPLWEKSLGAPGYEILRDLLVLPDGGIAILGVRGPAPWLVRLDAWGNVQWDRTYQYEGESLVALDHAPAGGFVMAGTASGSVAFTKDEGWLLRTDPWGHLSCSEAGPCAAETVESCTDGNPCTADLCSVADDGCAWEPVDDAGACGAEDVCVAATCVPSTCEPGTSLCHDDGGGFLLCEPSGSGWTSVACASDASCEGGTCTTPECVAGESWCEGEEAWTCTEGEEAVLVDDCATSGEVCDDGACVALACAPDSTTCEGDTLLTCASDGSGWAESACDDGSVCTVDTCQDGACVFTPEPEGTACEGGNPCKVYGCNGGAACVALSDKLWSRTYGGTGSDEFLAVASMPDGGVLAAGACGGCSDEAVVRVDAAGEVLWKKGFNGTVVSLVPDGEAGFVVRTGTLGVYRTDEALEVQWSLPAPPTYPEIDYDGIPTPTSDGGLLAPGTYDPAGSLPDAALVLADAGGSIEWDRVYGTTLEEEHAVQAAEAPGGGYVVAGHVGSTLAATRDAWLVGVSSDGSLTWQQSYPEEGDETILRLLAHPDGGWVLVGTWMAGKGSSERDVYVVRTDSAGNLLWSERYGGAGMQITADAEMLPDGGLLIGARDGGVPLLLRTDPHGNVVWEQTLDGTRLRDVAVFSDGAGYVAAGEAIGLTGQGDDGWLVRMDAWGHATCSASGICAGETPASCSDDSACTADLCAADQSGCYHETYADLAPCGDTAVCIGGSCEQ